MPRIADPDCKLCKGNGYYYANNARMECTCLIYVLNESYQARGTREMWKNYYEATKHMNRNQEVEKLEEIKKILMEKKRQLEEGKKVSDIHQEARYETFGSDLPLHKIDPKSAELFLTLEQALKGKRNEDQQLIAQEGLKWINLLLAKNADYGSSAFKEPILDPSLPATTAIKVRMSDKIQRLSSLATKEAEVDESYDDTIRDLGAYCLLYLVAKAKGNEKSE